MHKTFTLLTILFFINTTIKAQNTEKEYEKAVDYCACKIAYAYTKKFANDNPDSREKESFDDVIKKNIENCDKNTISNSELLKLLEDNNFKLFSEIVIPDAKDAKEKYKDNLSKTDAIKQLIGSFSKSFNRIDIKIELEDDLKSDRFLKSFISVNKSETNLKEGINRQERIVNEKSKVDNDSSFPNNWVLFILILILISLSSFRYNYFNNKKLNACIKRFDKEKITDLKKNSELNQHYKDSNSSKINIHQEKIDLSSAIEKPQKDNYNSPVPQPSQPNQPTTQQKIHKKTNKILYAKAPSEKGEFKTLEVSEEKESKFYTFTINDNNNNQAEFEFYNYENNARQAVDSPGIFLLPVCDNLGALDQKAKKIITNKKGIVIKQDDKWIVKEKAQITYE